MNNINTIDEFAKIIKTILENNYGIKDKIVIENITKNNNQELKALIFVNENSKLSPTIYLNSYYEKYSFDNTLNEICNDILGIYNNSINDENKPKIVIDDMVDYNKIKSKICFKLINLEKNKSLLSKIPYMTFNDLAIVFYININDINDSTKEIGTILIKNELFKQWNITLTDLYNDAYNNTKIIFNNTIKTMYDVVLNIASNNNIKLTDLIMDDLDQAPMYVAGNTTNINGAVCILYNDLLMDFANHIDSDFYILPSSIHEVILIPENDELDPKELQEMVSTINVSEVPVEDVLSDSIYKFDRKLGFIQFA